MRLIILCTLLTASAAAAQDWKTLTVVPHDNTIYLDRVPLKVPRIPGTPDSWTAVQVINGVGATVQVDRSEPTKLPPDDARIATWVQLWRDAKAASQAVPSAPSQTPEDLKSAAADQIMDLLVRRQRCELWQANDKLRGVLDRQKEIDDITANIERLIAILN